MSSYEFLLDPVAIMEERRKDKQKGKLRDALFRRYQCAKKAAAASEKSKIINNKGLRRHRPFVWG